MSNPEPIDVVKVLVEEPQKHAGGRPSLYDPSFVPKADEYLEQSQDEWDEFHKTRGEKSDTYERVVTVKLPSREGFAKFLGVSHDALSDWEVNYDGFGVALAKIDAEQKLRLMNEGLAGNYNPVIAKLLLSANHGLREKSDVTTDDEKLPPGIIYMPEKKVEGVH